MKQMKWAALAVVSIMIGMSVSCSREMFDEEKYNDLVDSISPVDTVDANHTWLLTQSKVLVVHVPDGGNARKVRILTANPRESGDAAVVGEAWVADGERTTMAVTYPATLSTLYAALVDADGKYSIQRFDASSETLIDFSDLVLDREGLSYDPQPQPFTYCFEEEYPAPGDYDYNDVVLRISQERTGEREMRFHVQLAAVGADGQMAAAMRLVGFKYDDIESVKTVDSLSFNTSMKGEDFPKSMMIVLQDRSFLLKGRNGEAVIGLFCDAHWATGDLLTINYGQMDRKKYNVSKTVSTSGDYQQFVPRTVTYIVTFKSSSGLNGLAMDQLDPFTIDEYNGGNFEVHQYAYRNASVLNSFSPSPIRNLPWALCIPKGDFRWPTEGVNMGFIMKEIHTFGAYQTYGHSFGEWSMDRTRCLDWYEYPTENQVF